MIRSIANFGSALLIGLGVLNPAIAESESNNTPATANAVTVNTTVSGSLGDSIAPGSLDHYDWYSVVLASDGALRINAQTGSDVDVSIILYCSVSDMNANSPSGDYYGSAGNSTVDSSVNYLHAGTYYFSLNRSSGKGSYSALITFTAAALSNDTENNDTAKLAQTIPPSSTSTGHMGYYSTSPGTDYYDWFKVDLPSDGTLHMNMVTSDGNLDASLILYCTVANFNACSPSGDYYGSAGNATTDSLINYLHAQTVWVLVTRSSGVGSYTLVSRFTPAALTNDSENNDTAKLAGDLSVDATITGHMGYYSTIPGTDYYDWYKIVLPSDGKLTVRSTTSDGTLDCSMLFYCKVANMNATSPSGDYYGSAGNTQTDSISMQLRAQTLYLLISRGSGVGSYSLQTAFSPASMANDAEPNDNPAHAGSIPLDSARSGHLGHYINDPGADYYDWFSIVVSSETNVKVSLLTTENLDCTLLFYKTVSDMNASSPSGDYYGSAGNAQRDSVSVLVQAGTYYFAVIRSSGAGSYSLASGNAIPTSTTAADKRPSFEPEIGEPDQRTLAITSGRSTPVPVAIAVYSLQGKRVFARNFITPAGNASLIIDKRQFAFGRYFCIMESNGMKRMLPFNVVGR